MVKGSRGLTPPPTSQANMESRKCDYKKMFNWDGQWSSVYDDRRDQKLEGGLGTPL